MQQNLLIGRLNSYFSLYFETFSVPTAQTLFLLLLSILALESAHSIRFLYRHFLSSITGKSLNAFYYACSHAKADYSRSCIYNRICVVGKKETIYPLVQTVNALYLQLLEMQKAFTSTGTLPDSDEIKELQTEYTNMLTAIIDLLDGAKYLWECEHH